jgi:hypothetical protein
MKIGTETPLGLLSYQRPNGPIWLIKILLLEDRIIEAKKSIQSQE